MSRTRLPLLALLALALLPASLHAQVGTQSDVSGPIVTTGDLGGVRPEGPRPQRGAVYVDRGGRVSFASPEVACAVALEADSLVLILGQGRLTSRGGASLPPGPQQALLALGSARVPDTVAVREFAMGLLGRPGASRAEAVAALGLSNALVSLFMAGNECPDARRNVDGAKWKGTATAYEQLIDVTPGSALAAPSPYLLTVQAVLERGIRAALDAAGS